MAASIRQLEMERNQVLTIVEEQKKLRQQAEEKLEEVQQQLAKMSKCVCGVCLCLFVSLYVCVHVVVQF